MGFFGGKRKVFVSSVAYNLLGDNKPTNWVATTITAASLANVPSIGEYFKDALFKDAAMRIRRFIQWTNGSSEYKEKFGIVSSSFYADYKVSAEQFQPLVQEEIRSFESSIGEFDPGHYAEWWIQENHPELVLRDYTVEEESYTDVYGSTHVNLIITFENGPVYTFAEETMDLSGLFLYVKYTTDSGTTIIYYQQNSGHPEYDSLFGSRIKLEGTYSPPIPFRIDNKFISDYEDDSLYHLAKRALVKALGGNNYKRFEDKIRENDSIEDIDYAYFMLGVNLNTKTKEGREYLFKFFQNLYENQPADSKENSFFISSDNTANLSFNFIVEWDDSKHYFKTGKCVEDAKPGKYYITTETQGEWQEEEDGSEAGNMVPVWVVTEKNVLFCKQITDSSYEVYEYCNLNHLNKIYKNHSVETLGYDAVNDSDPSPFIVPIELTSWKELGLVKANTLAQEINQIIFNCYVTKKVRWYQTGFFQFISIVIQVVIAYFTGQWWILGLTVLQGIANQIGGKFGKILSVVIFIITVLYAGYSIYGSYQQALNLAAQNTAVTTTRVTSASSGSIALVTEEGTQIGTISVEQANAVYSGSVSAEAVEQAAVATKTPSSVWGQLMTCKNLQTLTKPFSQGFSEYYKIALGNLQEDTVKLQAQVEDVYAVIKDALSIFNNHSTVDAGVIVNASRLQWEPRGTFLLRTLLVGSDICDLSFEMIHRYCDMNLDMTLA